MAKASVSDHPLIQHKLTLLRGVETESPHFRQLIQELSLLLGAEALRSLPCEPKTVQTPLGECQGHYLNVDIALIPILRAGLGMTDAMLQLLPQAKVWHLGMFRDEKELRPVAYYNKLPRGKPVKHALLLDPMLATGGSAVAAVDALKEWGVEQITFLGILAAPEGVQALTQNHPDVDIFLCGLDQKLNDKGYIVPGLGDAGDRQYRT
jgi:uracil phosphoribosyltransferase